MATAVFAMASSIGDELREVGIRVRRAHRAIERDLDTLAAQSARVRLGSVRKHELEDAIYDLYVRLDDHLLDEERMLEPLLSRLRRPDLSTDDAARVRLMFLEHSDQRALFLSALEHTEQGALGEEDLIALAARLTRTLQSDISLEDELLADLGI